MPNWCDNTISITGPAEKLSPMYTKLVAEEEEGLLSILYPQPKDIFKGDLGQKEREQCAKDGVPNWYDWNSSNWGTKWDVSEGDWQYEDAGDQNCLKYNIPVIVVSSSTSSQHFFFLICFICTNIFLLWSVAIIHHYSLLQLKTSHVYSYLISTLCGHL